MSSTNPYLVTPLVHPLPSAVDPQYAASMYPEGYIQYIERLGLGRFCEGLTVHTPLSRAFWTPSVKEDCLVMGLREGGWEPGVLQEDDLEECMVVASSDNGDLYITCPRFGRKIFELPRHESTIRYVGDSLDVLLSHYATRHNYAFAYFDPWPHCARRAAIGFVVRPEVGFSNLLDELQRSWGLLPLGAASRSDPDFYQDRFIPKLHAHAGFYFQDQRPPQYRNPAGSIHVTMVLDVDCLADAVDFAKRFMIAEGDDLKPNFGAPCQGHGQ